MRILVPEAHAMGSVACIRSLGRAGHAIIATSSAADALGFRSRWCQSSHVVPRGCSQVQLLRWFEDLVCDEAIDVVLPSEGLIATLEDDLDRWADRLPIGPDPCRRYRFFSKFELFRFFMQAEDEKLRTHLPSTVLAVQGEDWQDCLRSLRFPLFAKFDADSRKSLPARVLRLESPDEAVRRVEPMLFDYERAVVQEFAPGQGAGVFFLCWDGKILATLMHRRLHEVPHSGGVSSLRETWWNEALYTDALRRIEALGWWGVGMLEYRWNGDDRFWLMEFNARFWGSLHLALFAGVDFPRLLIDAWAGANVDAVTARPGVCCRYTFPKEVEYLWSLVGDPTVALGSKLSALVEAVALSCNPRVHSDLWFPGDRALYWDALLRTPGKFLRRSTAY